MGTRDGGMTTAKTNKRLHGSDFYSRIGALGGSKRTEKTKLKGYGSNRALASKSGKMSHGGGFKNKDVVERAWKASVETRQKKALATA